ncbi:2-hydroxyacyl-CoA dehydratase subunit D [Thermodesulfobacteriota bacterium]
MDSNNIKLGLEKANEIYSHRSKRARELKRQGKKIFGYFCCYPPVELMTALDIVPVRIMGDMDEPITIADGYLPTVMCSFYRSCLDIGLKGQYDYCDGFVGSHGCDAAERTTHIWENYIETPCSFYLDIPHTSHSGPVKFFREQINYFKEELENFIGKKIDNPRLQKAIALHNKQRALVRALYDIRKQDPPLITASEVLQVLISIMVIPVEEGNQLLKEVLEEVNTRENKPEPKPARVLIWGSLIDNTIFTELMEDSGLHAVIDDTGIGTRPFWHDIEKSDDPLEATAIHYLKELKCPRTIVETGATYMEDLENRFGYLRDLAREWHVNGIVANIIRNCDIHGYEVPAVKDYLEPLGFPVLVVEQNYSTSALAQFRTRFQAFSEKIRS